MKPLWRDGEVDMNPEALQKLIERAWEPDCSLMVVIIAPGGQDADIYRDDDKLPGYEDKDFGEWVSYGGTPRTLALRLAGAIHNW